MSAQANQTIAWSVAAEPVKTTLCNLIARFYDPMKKNPLGWNGHS